MTPATGWLLKVLLIDAANVFWSRPTGWWAITIDCDDPRRVADFWAGMFDCAVMKPMLVLRTRAR